MQGLLIFLGVRVEDEGEYTCSTSTDQFNHFLEVQGTQLAASRHSLVPKLACMGTRLCHDIDMQSERERESISRQ